MNYVTNVAAQQFRNEFPLLATNVNGKRYVYFDNAATTQKPQSVIASQNDYYQQYNANVHRGSHTLSAQATERYEQARQLARDFISASSIEEVIWTKGTTDAINLIAHSWGLANLTAGDEIVLSQSEHHANIVPWQLVADKTGAVIKVLPILNSGIIDVESLDSVISSSTKIVSIAHISNVVGRINPIETVVAKAKSVGAVTLIDGAQSIAHMNIDVRAIDCDFYVFSAHKMYGPTGVGLLYGKKSLLERMPPYQGGGEMIKHVTFQETRFNVLPFKFEAGTPNIAGVIAFAETINFNKRQMTSELAAHEQQLITALYEGLIKIKNVDLLFNEKPDIPLFSFSIKNMHSHDVAVALDVVGIAVRSGHHCAMPLIESLGLNGCVRASLSPYNTLEEVDLFCASLTNITEDNSIDNAKPNQQPLNLTAENIVNKFRNIKGWDSKHREIMLLSKQLPPLSDSEQISGNEVVGCESKAWLVAKIDKQGCIFFSAHSSAKVIRGLLVIVLAAYNGKKASQIIEFDIKDYFERLGLFQHLSPSRGNGLLAIVTKIEIIAKLHN